MSKRKSFEHGFKEQGISQSLLSRWVRELRARREQEGDSDESVRLRCENARLRLECDLSNKAVDYVAYASNPNYQCSRK